MKPERLRKGDTICIVSPGSPSLTREPYERGKRRLVRWGYRVVEGSHVNSRGLLFAGTPEERAEDINRAFADPAVKAVICARGGAGTLQILPYLDFGLIEKNPKILVGYSDITALELAILKRTGLITFYGPMVATELGKRLTAYTKSSFLATVSNGEGPLELKNPPGKEMVSLVPGKAEGPLTGGCLSIAVATLGTEHEMDTEGKILFFEDVDEKPHRVDRYLTQLTLAGKLQQARAILFGTFRRCSYKPGDSYYKYGVQLLDIVRNKVVPLGIPSVFGLQFGHEPDKLTLPLGAHAQVDTASMQFIVEAGVR
jgi:muramoyltetrapeptide carboxypeptidase